MKAPQVRRETHLILVEGGEGWDPQMFWGEVAEKRDDEDRPTDRFEVSLHSRSRPEFRARAGLRWTLRVPASMPMPLCPEDAPEWQASGRALKRARSTGPGIWSLDVK